jgi:hypothetical protein
MNAHIEVICPGGIYRPKKSIHEHILTRTRAETKATWRRVLLYSPKEKKKDFEKMLEDCGHAASTTWELMPMLSATAGQVRCILLSCVE